MPFLVRLVAALRGVGDGHVRVVAELVGDELVERIACTGDIETHVEHASLALL